LVTANGQDGAASARVFLRPIGTPLPLGFVGLAVATTVMACFDLRWIPVGEQHQVALVLIAFSFPLQALATILLFLARDAAAGAGIGVQSVSWLVLGLLMYTSPPGSRSVTVGIFLFAAAGALLPSALTSAMTKLIPGVVMLGTAVRFVLTGLYEKMGGPSWSHIAGWEGIALAGLAIYAAFAADLEGAFRRTVLPLGRRPPLEQHLADQFPRVEREPGVRQQL
jgi:succinate-acetate transporter protein